MSWTIEKILKGARKLGASDVHFVRGMAPLLRVTGDIHPLDGDALDEVCLQQMVQGMLTDKLRQQLEEEWQLCFSRNWADIGRFRVSVYMHSGCPEMSIRLCETIVRTADMLGLPSIIDDLTRRPSGLILVTGPTGVGKTTTLNFMIDSINRTRRAKIVTIEDPIEFVHENHRSVVIQQEVATDVRSFRSALIHVLRQDPDVIVVGEMRDLETIETALVGAETGHLVLATLHTPDAVQTIQRIFSVFPAEQQNSIISQLSNSLQAIISQKLVPRADGTGRVLACEICIATPAVRNHIRERETHKLYSELQTGKKHQMQVMDQVLLELYQRGDITYDAALSNAREPDYIRNRTNKSN